MRRSRCSAAATPMLGKALLMPQGQSTRQIEGTPALLRALSLGMKPNFHRYVILQYLLVSGACCHIRRRCDFTNQQRIPRMGEATCRPYSVLLQWHVSADTHPNISQRRTCAVDTAYTLHALPRGKCVPPYGASSGLDAF